MKHPHFDVESDSFCGAYRAFPAAGKYPKECRRARIDIEKWLYQVLAEWKGAK